MSGTTRRPEKRLRIAFSGIGHPHAPGWARAFRDLPEVDLIGAWDPDAERLMAFANEHGLVALDDAAILDPGVDGVIVNGRNNESGAMATGALRASKPVFIDKPGGMDSAELGGLIQTAEVAKVPLHVGYFLRQAASVTAIREALASGSLGRVSLVRVHAAMPHAAWTTMGDWFADPTNVTSIFQEDACHVLDVVYLLFGLPRAVVAARVSGQFAELAGEDALVAILEYPSHLVTVDFTAHEAQPWVSSWQVEVFGDRATARGGFRPGWVTWQPADEASAAEPTTPFPPAAIHDDDHAQHVRSAAAFVAAIDGKQLGQASASSGHDALDVFRIIDAVSEAARTGCRTHIDGTKPEIRV